MSAADVPPSAAAGGVKDAAEELNSDFKQFESKNENDYAGALESFVGFRPTRGKRSVSASPVHGIRPR